MPIYEYRCQSCGHELEQLQRMTDAALEKCPECGKSDLRRLISAAGFRLKGAGWYETDFKQGNKRNLAESGNGKGDGAAKAESSDGKTEAGSKTESAGKTPDASPAKSSAGVSAGPATGNATKAGSSASDST